MKITFHYYVIKYYQTQWTDNRMPDKRGTDNRGSTVQYYEIVVGKTNAKSRSSY